MVNNIHYDDAHTFPLKSVNGNCVSAVNISYVSLHILTFKYVLSKFFAYWKNLHTVETLRNNVWIASELLKVSMKKS